MPRVKQIVGLDLGSRNVRAVWVQLHGGKPTITRAEKMELPLEGGDSVALVRAWLEQLGLLKGFASVALPGTQLVFQPGRLTPDDPRTPRQAAEMELVRFSDMVGDTMVFDVTSLERADSSRQFLMSMARPAVVTSALSSLEGLSIRPTDLVPAPAALFCGLSAAATDDTPVLFVDIGCSRTEIAVGTSKGILFARSFPIGGRHFTEAIVKGGSCTVQQAELQKVRDGTLEEGGPFAEFLMPVAERWYAQLSTALAAYRSMVSGNGMAISSAVIVGGGAELRGFRQWIATKSGLDLVSDKTIATTGVIGGNLSTYAVAYGLALTSLDVQALPHLSLIPEALRDEVVFREKKPYWIATAITVALTLCVFTGGLIFMLGRESARLENERQELRKRERIDREIAKIREETEAIRKEVAPLRRLLVGGPASRYAISLVSTSIATEDWISLVCDEETYMSTEAPKQVKPVVKPARPGFFVPGFRDNDPLSKTTSDVFSDAESKPAPVNSKFTAFIVEGYTPNMGFDSLNEMLRRIRSGKRVKSVDLLSDDKVKPPAELPDSIKSLNLPEMRRFVIRLEVAQP